MHRPFVLLLVASISIVLGWRGRAFALEPPASPPPPRAHGPEAPDDQFPSHVFRLEAHQPRRVQLGFDFGLTQPILLHGFNAAVDVRFKRVILTYSHGQGLDATPFLGSTEKAAGMTLREPYSTGGGVGVLLIDELWVLADFKVHHFEADTALDRQTYTNVTIGGEIGWRYFVWKGFNVALVARYWPNVYSTAGRGITMRDATGKPFFHEPLQQGYDGLFGNVLVGWAFDL
jgi:hypothetical protein